MQMHLIYHFRRAHPKVRVQRLPFSTWLRSRNCQLPQLVSQATHVDTELVPVKDRVEELSIEGYCLPVKIDKALESLAKSLQHVHLDSVGPFLDKTFFMVVDALSEVYEMTSTTACAIDVLRHLFAVYGLPLQLVSHAKVENILLKYGTTPHGTAGRTPASLFMSRDLRTKLDLLKPNCGDRVLVSQAKQEQRQHSHTRDLLVGQTVMARNYGPGAKWIAGGIKKQGPVMYVVETEKGLWKRHIDQIRERENSTTGSTPELTDDSDNLDFMPDVDMGATHNPPLPPTPPETTPPETAPEVATPPPVAPQPDPPAPRYPVRTRQPPDYFGH